MPTAVRRVTERDTVHRTSTRTASDPEAVALAWLTRHCRVSPALAVTVRDLTGLGARREVSR